MSRGSPPPSALLDPLEGEHQFIDNGRFHALVGWSLAGIGVIRGDDGPPRRVGKGFGDPPLISGRFADLQGFVDMATRAGALNPIGKVRHMHMAENEFLQIQRLL